MSFTIHRRIILIGALLLLFVFAFIHAASGAMNRITLLKDLHLTTSLVENGKAQAIIVAPKGDRYRRQAEYVQEGIKRFSGIELPIKNDDFTPLELLREHHVIALGNMATNAFIETLYRQWQVILDLKYPGAGGVVVRSLHNPYGSDHNVIFLGGSDDAGVSEAARIFVKELKGNADALNVGWLMKIKLGKGLNAPFIRANLKKWNVQSWNDSRRRASDETESGYDPGTYFGWNPISIAGALYYMTGEKEFLDTFKELAIPNHRQLPEINRASEAFTDPSNPLVKSDHYRAHLVDCIYDLIEESPLFTDEERLLITNKLMEHQYELDPTSTYSVPNGDRHSMWHMINIYTGSRYFAWSYPSPVWERRMDNARKGFRSFINSASLSDDTLEWVSTYIEPVFDFYLLDGHEEFVRSQTAQTLMKWLEVLMTGEEIDDCNKFIPVNLLLKAAHLLQDGRYIWMMRRLGFNLDTFRIGQSYWPPPVAESKLPADLVNRVTVVPLAKANRDSARTPVNLQEAFQLLSFRTGLEKTDDYLLLDGFEGLGRHPYQLNTFVRLRMFGGKNILSGYANDLSIWHNGMTGAHVARSAALKQQLATNEFAYVHTEVPDMPVSNWQRRIIYLKDRWTIVVDRVTAMQAGRFDIASFWQMGSGIKTMDRPSRRIISANGAGLMSAEIPFEQVSSSVVQGKVSRELNTNESVMLGALFYDTSSTEGISPLKQGGYLLSGSQTGYVGVGPYRSSAFLVIADFAYLDRNRMLLVGATELTIQDRVIFSSDRPVTVIWNFKDISVTILSSETARILFGIPGREIHTFVTPGERIIDIAGLQEDLPGIIDFILRGLKSELTEPEGDGEKTIKSLPDWKPDWEIGFDGRINTIAEDNSLDNAAQAMWVVSQKDGKSTILRIGMDGKLLNTIQQIGEVLSIWPAKDEKQSRAFSLLVGFKDDMLRAFSKDGKEIWSVKAAIHPSFMIGDHYNAPWFTDPRPPFNMTGVYSILAGDFWGKRKEEIAIGRPCTVEFYDLDGRLKARVPTRWGNNTALALLPNPEIHGKTPLLLAGKAFTGNPQLSGIDHAYTNVSDGLYDQIVPGFANMHAWLQRGTSGLRVADINGDGSDEIAYTLSGHWNELRVYDTGGNALWMKFFGPDKSGSTFMPALELADIDGDGFKEILVGTKHGWMSAFNYQGNLLWQRHFKSGITALSVSEKRLMIAIGCQDGALVLLDAAGSQLASGNMGAPVTSLTFGADGVLAGNSKGMVRYYSARR